MRLTDSDAGFLYTETASGPMQISSIYVLDGEAPFDRLFHHFEARIHLVPRYRQRLALVPFNLAHPKWVDDPDFDLAYHVRHHKLDRPMTLEEAVDEAMVLNQKLLDRRRPLWLTYVIEGVPGKTLLLQLVHHAMIDGVSGVELTTVLYDFDPAAADPPPAAEPWQPTEPPGALELMNEAAREAVDKLRDYNPVSALGGDAARRKLAARAARVVSGFVTRPAMTAPWNAGLVGPQRKLRWLKKNLLEVREIRRGLGGTINDLVLAVVSEGAARYMDDTGEHARGRHLRIMCPVSVRREDEQGALGNRVSAIFPCLPAWPMPATERLRAVREETERIKHEQDAQALTLLLESTPPLPPVAMAPTQLVGTALDPTALAARMPLPVLPRSGPRPPYFGFNFTCTNVPGVQVPQYMAGHELTETLGILMLTGTLGFGVAVTSYNGHLYFNFVCDPRLLPDLEAMRDAADGVFNELLDAARAGHAGEPDRAPPPKEE